MSPSLAVGLALGSIVGAAATPGVIVFREDFEAGAELSERGWTIEAEADQSPWRVEDGRLHCVLLKKPYDGGCIVHRIPPVKRGYFELEARVARKGSWGMGLKLVFNGMLLTFDNKQKANLDRYIAKKGWQEVARGEFDRWHRKQYCAEGWEEKRLGWQAATSVHLDRGFWCAEIVLPLAALEATCRSGDEWRLNFCRNRPLAGGGISYSAWAGFFSDSFHNTAGFGRLRFR